MNTIFKQLDYTGIAYMQSVWLIYTRNVTTVTSKVTWRFCYGNVSNILDPKIKKYDYK